MKRSELVKESQAQIKSENEIKMLDGAKNAVAAVIVYLADDYNDIDLKVLENAHDLLTKKLKLATEQVKAASVVKLPVKS